MLRVGMVVGYDVDGGEWLLRGVRRRVVDGTLLIRMNGKGPCKRQAKGRENGAVGPENTEDGKQEGEEGKKARHGYLGLEGMRRRSCFHTGRRRTLTVRGVLAERGRRGNREGRRDQTVTDSEGGNALSSEAVNSKRC